MEMLEMCVLLIILYSLCSIHMKNAIYMYISTLYYPYICVDINYVYAIYMVCVYIYVVCGYNFMYIYHTYIWYVHTI